MRPRFFTTAPPLIAVALFVASCGATPDSDQTDAVAAGTDNGADSDVDSGTGSEAPIEDIAPTTDGLAAPAATDAPAGSEAPVPTEPVPTEPATTEPAAQPVVEPSAERGYRKLFLQSVTQADQGVDFDFLQPPQRTQRVPRT